MDNQANAFEDLFSKTTDYLETRGELVRLKAVSKLSHIAASFISRMVIWVIAIMVIIFFNIGVALWLGDIFGQPYLGFFAVTGFYLLVLIIIFATRQNMIKTPIKDSIIKHLLK